MLPGYRFNNSALLEQALTHASFFEGRPYPRPPDQQRLEWLGDAVLQGIVSRFLFEHYPDRDSGQLTKLRSARTNNGALTYCFEGMGLGRYVRLGRGVMLTRKICADTLEAVIGAVYLDGGEAAATRLVMHEMYRFLEVGKGDPIT